jgi:hypothetical protein
MPAGITIGAEDAEAIKANPGVQQFLQRLEQAEALHLGRQRANAQKRRRR